MIRGEVEAALLQMEELARQAKASSSYPAGKVSLTQRMGGDLLAYIAILRRALSGESGSTDDSIPAAYWMMQCRDLYFELRFTLQHRDSTDAGLPLGAIYPSDEFALEESAARGLERRKAVREFARRTNEPRSADANERHRQWIEVDEELRRTRPSVKAKTARARIIRERLKDTATVDHISRKLPRR